MPELGFVQQLVERNEHLIASNHPLRQDIIAKVGATPERRRKAVLRVFDDAKVAVPYTWTGVRGYEPATSAFYRDIVRSLAR
jgi:hypothetical protein